MKKIFTLLVVFACTLSSFASLPVTPKLKATEIFVPVGNTGKLISLYDLAYIKVKDYERLTGKHLRTTDRIGLKLAQRDIRKNMAADGTLHNKRINKSFAKIAAGEYGFHFGGFALGFFLGLIGILVAYLIKDDYKRNRVKWAWLGFGIYVVIYLAIRLLLI